MEMLITLIGLVLIVEGLPYAAFPEAMKRWLAQLQELPPESMRKFGLFFLCLGFLLCYIAPKL